ncbi:hypothetical protein B9Z19DRAFT_1065380 [Tuber borchii]|uniref:Uncharacterized protein n=1 Tax=Tuber borchii TaxID=42251 RepID=A0A2T6ZRC1_TUBBO|nr:hypothetical protein B9Z19DRAFT_1065380 [Tuber borchii]
MVVVPPPAPPFFPALSSRKAHSPQPVQAHSLQPVQAPAPIATLSIMENFTCTDYNSTFIAVKCPGYVTGYTSVTTIPCTPGREYGILRDHVCREAELQAVLTIIMSVVFSLAVIAFILAGAYVLRKRIKRKALTVWRAPGVENGKEGNDSQNAVEEGLVTRVECKVPPKAFDPKKTVPANHSSGGDGDLVRISPYDDGGKRSDGCGCM